MLAVWANVAKGNTCIVLDVLDTEAGETTAGEGVVETLTAPTWLSPPLVSGMPTKPSPPVIAGTDVLLGSESGMDCGAAIKRS